MAPPSFAEAREIYGSLGVDVEAALLKVPTIGVSLPCWQGDDVGGFERPGAELKGGGIAVTGSYPGKARSVAELRQDLEQAVALLPTHGARVNLHAIYGEFPAGRPVERDQVAPAHFQGWADWARAKRLSLDFNPTFFSHPLANDGGTLSHRDPAVRKFWVAHGVACRRIGAFLGRSQGNLAVTNVWIPDGSKDAPADRRGPRERLAASLDEIFREAIDPAHNLDAVESKLFGIGSESYVVGSHEFYLGYAALRQKLLCLDMGHFHPTESVADKISAVQAFVPGVLLHLSRGVRWDSDHVVLFDDITRAVVDEVVVGGYLDRTYIGLDYFDASINRVAAWVIGARNTLKCLLAAHLRPQARLAELEAAGDATGRLALMEDGRALPFGAVWTELCRRLNVPDDSRWLAEIRTYERNVLSRRA